MDSLGLNRSFVIKGSHFVMNIFLLNTIIILGTVFSFGILFIPLTVGSMYLFRKIIMYENFSFWKDFYHGFKINLKVSIFLSILFLILLYFLWINIKNNQLIDNRHLMYDLLAITEIYGLFILWIYGSGIIARFDVGFYKVIKFSFIVGNSHFLSTLMMIGIGILLGSLYFLLKYLIVFIMIAFYLFIVSIILFRILKKFEPK